MLAWLNTGFVNVRMSPALSLPPGASGCSVSVIACSVTVMFVVLAAARAVVLATDGAASASAPPAVSAVVAASAAARRGIQLCCMRFLLESGQMNVRRCYARRRPRSNAVAFGALCGRVAWVRRRRVGRRGPA